MEPFYLTQHTLWSYYNGHPTHDLCHSGTEGSAALYSVREITTSGSGTANHLEPVYTNNKATVQVYPAPADAHAYTMDSGWYTLNLFSKLPYKRGLDFLDIQ